MTYYLIDYENTGENGLEGLLDLESSDKVVIFYSENADKMSFDLHQQLQECDAVIEFQKIAVGKKNALDFQLAAYLGYLMAKEENGQFCIVSKDLGSGFLAGEKYKTNRFHIHGDGKKHKRVGCFGGEASPFGGRRRSSHCDSVCRQRKKQADCQQHAGKTVWQQESGRVV